MSYWIPSSCDAAVPHRPCVWKTINTGEDYHKKITSINSYSINLNLPFSYFSSPQVHYETMQLHHSHIPSALGSFGSTGTHDLWMSDASYHRILTTSKKILLVIIMLLGSLLSSFGWPVLCRCQCGCQPERFILWNRSYILHWGKPTRKSSYFNSSQLWWKKGPRTFSKQSGKLFSENAKYSLLKPTI